MDTKEKSTTDTTKDDSEITLQTLLGLFEMQIKELQQAHQNTHELLIEVLRDHNSLCDLCDNLTTEVANLKKDGARE